MKTGTCVIAGLIMILMLSVSAEGRMLSAATGKFIDPMGEVPDPYLVQPAQTNLYNYVGNSPVNNIDPFGLWTLQIGSGGSAGAGGGGTATSGFVIGGTGFWPDQLGFYETRGGGGYGGAGGGFTWEVSYSNNKNICDLKGKAGTVQFNAGPPGRLISGSVETNFMPGYAPTSGISVNAGWNATPVGANGFVTNTYIQQLW